MNARSTLKHLQRLHALAINTHGGFSTSNPTFFPLTTKLISLASLVGPSMDYAHHLFDALPHPDPVAWNAVVRGFSVFGPFRHAIVLYRDMHRFGVVTEQTTFPFVVRSCAVLGTSREGREVHCVVVKNGFGVDFHGQTALVDMYAKCGEVRNAEMVFEDMTVRNVVSWTAMVSGYACNGFDDDAVGVFKSMVSFGLWPNSVTVVSVLPSCGRRGHRNLGNAIHSLVIGLGLDNDHKVMNSLISMYGKFGEVRSALVLFGRTDERNLVAWNTMISVYEQNCAYAKAIVLFRVMRRTQMRYNNVTIVSVISACARSGDLETGKWIHKLMIVEDLAPNEAITNALLDMYAKCGCLDLSRQIFDDLPNKSVVSWSAMVGAYAALGSGRDALELFDKMKAEGLRPTSLTFTSVLSACSREGLVEDGMKQFDAMRQDYLVHPTLEHYTCVVDLLGRAGRLFEAFNFIQKMTVEPDSGIWGALLNACRLYGNVFLAEAVSKRLFQLNLMKVSFYVLVSNIYAESGKWEDAERLWKLMREEDVKKLPGHSISESYGKQSLGI